MRASAPPESLALDCSTGQLTSASAASAGGHVGTRSPRVSGAGPDGLDVLRRLVPAAAARGAGVLAVELGAGQADAVEALAREAGFKRTERRPDLAGIDRVVLAWR